MSTYLNALVPCNWMIEHIFLGEVELLYLMKWLVSVCYADTPQLSITFYSYRKGSCATPDHLSGPPSPSPLSVPLNIEPQFNYNTIILCLSSTDVELQRIQEHDTATRGKASTWFQYPALVVSIKTTHTQNPVML